MAGLTKYCEHCGYANVDDAQSCKLCGFTGFTSERPDNFKLHESKSNEKPTGIAVMAVAQLVVSSIEIIAPEIFFGTLLIGSLGYGLKLMLVILGTISLPFSLVIALALLTGKPWGRTAMVFNGVFDLLMIPAGTVFGIISIIYFMRRNVVDYFKRKNY